MNIIRTFLAIIALYLIVGCLIVINNHTGLVHEVMIWPKTVITMLH